jgi:hypothetical protein
MLKKSIELTRGLGVTKTPCCSTFIVNANIGSRDFNRCGVDGIDLAGSEAWPGDRYIRTRRGIGAGKYCAIIAG